MCAAFLCTAITRETPWTVHVARALFSSYVWITDLAEYCIFAAVRVIVAIQTSSRRDAWSRLAAFFRTATTKKKPWTVHAARTNSLSCVWVTDLVKCCIFVTAQVIVAI